MKLKEKKLRQIIREELMYRTALLEGYWDDTKQDDKSEHEKQIAREPRS